MDKQQIKNEINELISKGKTKKAIDFLLDKTQSNQKEEVIILSNRFNEIKRKQRMGVITPQEEQLELNRINSSILQIIYELNIENNTILTQPKQVNQEEKRNIPKSNLAQIVLAICAVITLFYTISYTSCKNDLDKTEQNLPQKINDNKEIPKIDSLIESPSVQTSNIPNTQEEILIEPEPTPPKIDSEIELAVKHLLSDSSFLKNKFEELIVEKKFDKALQALNLAQIKDTKESKSYYFNNRRKSIYLVKQYDDIDNAWISFPRTLILTQKDSKYGLYDRNGNEVSKPKFDEIDPIFFGDLYCTELDGMYGFFNEKGKEIFQPIFSEVDPTVYEDMILVKKDGLYGTLSFDGNYILKPIFTEITRVWSDVILTNTKGKWGAIDLGGNEIIENKYDKLEYIKREEVYYAEINRKKIYLDRFGKTTKNPGLN